MATSKDNEPKTPELRAGIVKANFDAMGAALAARQDANLGPGRDCVSEAWAGVSDALKASRTPDPEDPGSEAEWAFRQPIIQKMADTIRATEASLRNGGGPGVCAALVAQLAELKDKLAERDAPKSAIGFSEKLARDNFSSRTKAMLARDARPGGDFEAGQARAQARQGGSQSCQ